MSGLGIPLWVPRQYRKDPDFIRVKELISNNPPEGTKFEDGTPIDPHHIVTVYVPDPGNKTTYRALVEATKKLEKVLDERHRDGTLPTLRRLVCLRFSHERQPAKLLLHCGFWSEDDRPTVLVSVN